MGTTHLVLAALAAAAASTAGAQTLKPGLWQITHRIEGAGADTSQAMADMRNRMEAMPPEQRKSAQDMLARQGVQMGSGSPGGMTLNVCMTPEMVRRDELPSQRGDCNSTARARSGNVMRFAFACTNPPSKGEGEVTFMSPEAYLSKVTVTTTVQGQPRQMTSESSGKWLGADCGKVKPIAPPGR